MWFKPFKHRFFFFILTSTIAAFLGCSEEHLDQEAANKMNAKEVVQKANPEEIQVEIMLKDQRRARADAGQSVSQAPSATTAPYLGQSLATSSASAACVGQTQPSIYCPPVATDYGAPGIGSGIYGGLGGYAGLDGLGGFGGFGGLDVPGPGPGPVHGPGPGPLFGPGYPFYAFDLLVDDDDHFSDDECEEDDFDCDDHCDEDDFHCDEEDDGDDHCEDEDDHCGDD